MAGKTRGTQVSLADDLRNVAQKARKQADARCLGIAALIPPLEVFRRISFSLPLALSKRVVGPACIAALVAGLFCALTLMLVLAARGQHARSRALADLGLGLAAAGMACMLPCALGIAPFGAALPALGYFLVGSAFPTLLLGWIGAFTSNGTLGNLVYVCLSVLMGGSSLFVVVRLDEPFALWCLLIACFVVSSLLLWSITGKGQQRKTGSSSAGCPNRDAAPPSSESREERSTLDAVRSSLTAPAMGLALGVFSWGVMAVPPMPYVQDHKAWVYLAGELVALCVILTLAYSLRNDASYGIFRQKMFFLLPVFAVFMSYFSFIRMLNADGTLKNVLSLGYNMSMAGFFTLFCVACAEQCKEKGLTVESTAGPALIACTLSYGMGALLYEAYGNNAMYFQIVLTTLYILGLAFISSHRASLNDDSRLRERCAQTSRKFGLSQREEEVLALTVAGYSVARVAEELTISPETVRTHKKRIYAKLDVHRHDDLMRVVRTGGHG